MEREKNLFRRICDFKDLFFNHDEFLKLPKQAKRLWYLDLLFRILMEVLVQIPAVILALATSLITKNVVLAIIFLVVWVLCDPLTTAIRTLDRLNSNVLGTFLGENIIAIANKILNFTRDKVEITRDGRKQTMSSTIIIKTVADYLNAFLKCRDSVIQALVASFLFLFTFASMIQLAKEQVENTWLLCIVTVIIAIASIVVQTRGVKRTASYYCLLRPLEDDIENAKRDLKEVEPMSLKHSSFMFDRLSTAQSKKLKITLKEHRKKSLDEVIVSVVKSIGVLFIVLFICLENGVSGLDAEKFLNAIAISRLMSSILSNIGIQIRQFFGLLEDQMEYEKYSEDYKKITEVYYEIKNVKEKAYNGNTLVINPFSFTYNISNFHLTSQKSIRLSKGELTLLKGNSGVGKSTLVKILAGDLKVDGLSEKLISVGYFNDESRLGSGNLLEEITLERAENVDSTKLEEIILGIQLGSKFKTVDSLSKVSCKELSNGLRQRVLIARTLYNLGNSDLVCIDEPIGSLDSYNAKKVVDFIKEYCNRDKKRFVLICTHQYELNKEMIDKSYEIVAIDANNSKIVG